MAELPPGLMAMLLADQEQQRQRGLMTHWQSGSGNPREGRSFGEMAGRLKDQTLGGLMDVAQSFRKMDPNYIPRSALDGEYQPPNVDDGLNIAGAVTVGAGAMPTRGVLMGEKPSIGIFGGQTAKTADHAALARAQKMVASGADRGAIWADTGWFKGVDDKWRFEIDDSARKVDIPGARKAREDAAFNLASDFEDASRIKARAARLGISIADAIKSIETETGKPVSNNAVAYAKTDLFSQKQLAEKADSTLLGAIQGRGYDDPFRIRDVMDHDPLFGAYTGIKHRPLKVGGHGFAQYDAAYLPDDQSFFVQKYIDDDPSYSLGHEMQHYIQDYEKFAQGGNVSTTVAKTLAPIEKQITKLADDGAWEGFDKFRNSPAGRANGWSHNETVAEYRRLFPQDEKFAQIADLDAKKSALLSQGQKEYNRLAGEVEARNVQARRDMTPDQRRASPPWTTQDVPDAEQIIRMDSKGPAALRAYLEKHEGKR